MANSDSGKFWRASSGREGLLDNATVSQLLLTAYYASFIMDEGRTPIAKIHCMHSLLGQNSFVRFTPSIPIDSPEKLAKIAQAIDEDFALEITREDPPQFEGIIRYEPFRLRDYAFPRKRPDSAFGTTIVIREPGNVEFYELEIGFSYRHGIIRKYNHITTSGNVSKWISDVDAVMQRRLVLPDELKDGFFVKRYTTEAVIADILRYIVSMKHGGMVVILPDRATDLIRFGFRTNSNELVDAIQKNWEARHETWLPAKVNNDTPDTTTEAKGVFKLARDEFDSNFALERKVKCVAQFANLDGCLAFSRDLEIIGFAGVIQAQAPAKASTRALKDGRGRPLSEESVLGSRGTRHRAAFELCKSVPGCIAFVISQDGDLRVFSSDEHSVYFEVDMRP